MKTRKGEKEKLKTVILDRAIAYLKKHGRGEAGTDQIMKYAGLSRGALYSHFKSKDDLFAQAVCHDLARVEGSVALKGMIEDHLSERSLSDVGSSCAFTSLSTDMQRCKAGHRALYEQHMIRIYGMFAAALKDQFPDDPPEENLAKATNLYSALVGTLTMARTISDPALATTTLEAGKRYLVSTFVPRI